MEKTEDSKKGFNGIKILFLIVGVVILAFFIKPLAIILGSVLFYQTSAMFVIIPLFVVLPAAIVYGISNYLIKSPHTKKIIAVCTITIIIVYTAMFFYQQIKYQAFYGQCRGSYPAYACKWLWIADGLKNENDKQVLRSWQAWYDNNKGFVGYTPNSSYVFGYGGIYNGNGVVESIECKLDCSNRPEKAALKEYFPHSVSYCPNKCTFYVPWPEKCFVPMDGWTASACYPDTFAYYDSDKKAVVLFGQYDVNPFINGFVKNFHIWELSTDTGVLTKIQ